MSEPEKTNTVVFVVAVEIPEDRHIVELDRAARLTMDHLREQGFTTARAWAAVEEPAAAAIAAVDAP